MKKGFTVLEADNGLDGLAVAEAEKPELILLDLIMPGMHGFAVCKQLRENPALDKTTIIITSSKSYKPDIDKALELGADAYIIKPVEFDELFQIANEKMEQRLKVNAVKVRFWGTRGSIATPGPATLKYGGNTSCVEVRANGHILVFDAGTGIHNLGIQLQKEFPSQPITVHIFISHTHWDHIQGFPFFLPAYGPTEQDHHLRAAGER